MTRKQQEDDDVQRFDRWSRTYDRSWSQPLFFDRIHRTVLNRLAIDSNGVPPESVLDVGCGTGRLLRLAGQRWPAARLLGVDPAEGMVKVASRLTPAATFYVGSAESLPLPSASVHVVVSTLSFHHWKDQVAGISEIARVLVPGGRFILADFLLPLGLSRITTHLRSNEPAAVRELFTQAGITVQVQERAVWHVVLVTSGRK